MRFKIPRKKQRITIIAGLLLAFVFPVLSVADTTDVIKQTDRSLFWSIHKDGQHSGHLLGTIHSEDPRVLDFSEDMLAKLGANKVFAMELVPDMSTLERLSSYMQYPPGQSLEEVIGNRRYQALAAALSAYQVPMSMVRTMKPWAAMMTLSTPPPQTGFFMDLSLSLRASGNGLKVVGLETLEQQLSFLEDMPMPMQLSLLDQAIAESGNVAEVHDQMVSVYLENDLVGLQALTDEQLEAVDEGAGNYFMDAGIRKRNHRMAESLLLELENNTVFVAVGALHLPGTEGILSILRSHGYVLSPLAMPIRQLP